MLHACVGMFWGFKSIRLSMLAVGMRNAENFHNMPTSSVGMAPSNRRP
jgi:hypothetical protein